LGITAIVDMRMKSVHSGKNIPGISYLHLPTLDRHAPSIEHLEQGVKFIRKEIKKGGKVYIHCKAGEGRGPTMAAAYLIYSGLSLDDALKTIKKARRFIHPTKSQIDQLKRFEEIIIQKSEKFV
jgi:dual specificity MAP kinase phosphatase